MKTSQSSPSTLSSDDLDIITDTSTTATNLARLFGGRQLSRREIARIKPAVARRRYGGYLAPYSVQEERRLLEEERKLDHTLGRLASGWAGRGYMR